MLDPSGAAIVGATVTIHNPVSGYERATTTDSAGNFTFPNVPFNPYHLTVSAAGFAEHAQDVEVRSSVPESVKVSMAVAGTATTVTVEGGGDLVENDSTFHTDVDRDLFDKLPLESQSSSVSSLVTLATPGVAADSNGLFHGLGDHAANSFSVDGQPITDQQSKVFSNQIPVDSVQSMEVISGSAAGGVWRQDEPGDQGDDAIGPGGDYAAREHQCFVRQFWDFHWRVRSGVWRSEVGEFYCGGRTEQRDDFSTLRNLR